MDTVFRNLLSRLAEAEAENDDEFRAEWRDHLRALLTSWYSGERDCATESDVLTFMSERMRCDEQSLHMLRLERDFVCDQDEGVFEDEDNLPHTIDQLEWQLDVLGRIIAEVQRRS